MRLLEKDTQGKDLTLTSSPWLSSCPSSHRMLSFPARRITKCRAAAQSQAGPGGGGAARGERTLPQTEVCVTTRAPRPSQPEPKVHPAPPRPPNRSPQAGPWLSTCPSAPDTGSGMPGGGAQSQQPQLCKESSPQSLHPPSTQPPLRLHCGVHGSPEG